MSKLRDYRTPVGRCSGRVGRNRELGETALTSSVRATSRRRDLRAGLASATVGAAQPPSDEGVTTIGPLLERRQELARIESALAEAREGRGRFLVIEGPAGIGKTALLATARTVAAHGGMRVLRSRGAELERDFAFGVVRQLFEAVLAEASELERADLLEGGAGVAAGLLGLPGAPPAEGPSASGVDPSFAILHVLRALDADVTHHSVPIAPRERDANGEISHTKTLDELQAVVVALARRAAQAV